MKISAAVKLIKRIAAKDPYAWASAYLTGYVCQFCGGMGEKPRDVLHVEKCIWVEAHELVRTAR